MYKFHTTENINVKEMNLRQLALIYDASKALTEILKPFASNEVNINDTLRFLELLKTLKITSGDFSYRVFILKYTYGRNY